jgi:hypothetical protein
LTRVETSELLRYISNEYRNEIDSHFAIPAGDVALIAAVSGRFACQPGFCRGSWRFQHPNGPLTQEK